VKTTIEIRLQNRVNQIAKYYYNQYKQNEVHNLAILVDVSNRESDELCGQLANGWESSKDVDIIDAPRSTGSILKPLLYAGMLDDGELLPNTLVQISQRRLRAARLKFQPDI
jgi:penicillin-binding protein 1C